MLTVNEIFHSIQGESTYAGLPCAFVRLTACDLRCSWCDTAYAFSGGGKMSVAEVMDAVARTGCRLVEITGGEPLLQDDVYPLMAELLKTGHEVLVETGGHLDADRVPPGVIRVLDVKCPSSGEAARTYWPNLDRLRPTDQVKFVVQDRGDFEYALRVIRERDLAARCAAVLCAPVHGVLAPADLSAWVLASGLPLRVQLQVHKYIWGADTRGV